MLFQTQKIFVDVDVRGEFAMTATNAEFPKSTNASAVGGVQSGQEAVIREGYAWLVTGCAGKRFAGMSADFTADMALVVAATNSPASTPADWVIDESGIATTLPPTNQLPTVSISSPATGTSVTVNTAVPIVYTASDPDGSIADVKLVVGGVEQSLTPSDNTFTYTPTTTGSKSIAVRVTDNSGASVTSSPISLTVNALANVPPTVSISSPSTGTEIDAGSSQAIAFVAADSDGTIADIKLVVNGTEETLAASGNTFTYTPPAAGSYTIAVRVTDNSGAVTTSTPITLVVNAVVVPTVESFVRAINFGGIARRWGNKQYEAYQTGTTPAGMTATQVYFNTSPITDGSGYSPTIADVDQFWSTKTFAYNLQNLRFTGLPNGTYKVYMGIQRLYDTTTSVLQVNGQSVNVQAGSSGPAWITVAATATVTAGTLTIHDPTTSSSEGEVQLCWIELYEIVAENVTLVGPTVTIPSASLKSNGFEVRWGYVRGATGYELTISTDSAHTLPVSGYNNLAVSGLYKVITGLSANIQYYVRVRPTNTTGPGPNGTANATTLQGPVAFGNIYHKPTGWSDLTDFSLNGGITMSLSGTDIVIGGGTGTFTRYATFGGAMMLDKWKMSAQFEITEITGTSYGVGLGTRSLNTTGQAAAMGRFSHAIDPLGKSIIDILSSGTWAEKVTEGDSPLVVGDIVTFEVEMNATVLTARLIRPGSSDILATYSYAYPITSDRFLPNTFTPAISAFGGSVKMKALTVSTQAYRRAKLSIVGDSITQAYLADAESNRYPSQLETLYGGINNLGAGFDKTEEILTRIDQINSLQSQRVLLAIGYNDRDQGVPLNTILANYDSIASQIIASGSELYHMTIPTTVTANSTQPIADHIAQKYPASNIITVNPSLSGDGIHPSPSGMTQIATAISAKIGTLLT